MERTTIYLEDAQKRRIDKLPRNISFSAIIRAKFDIIMEECESQFVKAVR